MKTSRTRVAVAMSGGVDSSAAAALLLDQGHDVVGFTMDFNSTGAPRRLWSCRQGALRDARRVARSLGIAHTVVCVRTAIERRVIRDFIDEYAAGRTPNPCVRCNAFVKFGTLLEAARRSRAAYLATGHYARIVRSKGAYALCAGRDPAKDQSYFLYRLTQEQLSAVMFPLGGMTKLQVREYARRRGIPVAEKPGSQEICFLAGSDYRSFLKKYGTAKLGTPGLIVDTVGRVLGRHAGLARYTVGQRGGLGIAGAYPLYVISMDAASGRIVVGSRDEALRGHCSLRDVHWILGRPKKSIVTDVKIRYNHKGARARVSVREGGRADVVFRRGQFAITPGQSAVFYSGERVLGGGIIT